MGSGRAGATRGRSTATSTRNPTVSPIGRSAPPRTYDTDLGEFVLPYRAVRLADDPDAVLLDFLQRTYEAAAELGSWDRAALEDRASSLTDDSLTDGSPRDS